MTVSLAAPSTQVRFADVSDQRLEKPTPWRPFKVSAAEIEAEIDRLAEAPTPANGRRASLILHPQSTAPGLGFAPAIDVTIEVLKPGESTLPVRRNSSQVTIDIQGSGTVRVADEAIELAKWDVCNIPSMKAYSFQNSGEQLWVRLTYSNAPLLAKLGAGYAETITESTGSVTSLPSEKYNRGTAPDFEVSPRGSRLRGYEFLTDIKVVESNAHHWPWAQVSTHLSSSPGDGKRMIMAMYNPATERRNGATPNFFVTAARIPAGVPLPLPERGHRHNSTAINYHFQGEGASVVAGERLEWSAGDLLLSAPGWSEHAHSGGGQHTTSVFTVQDHPLHIGMESLIWQEEMGGPILTLGSEAGVTGYVGPREAGA